MKNQPTCTTDQLNVVLIELLHQMSSMIRDRAQMLGWYFCLAIESDTGFNSNISQAFGHGTTVIESSRFKNNKYFYKNIVEYTDMEP